MTAALSHIGTKICTGCGPQPFSAFGVHGSKGRVGKLRARCKTCESTYSATRAEQHPEKCRASEKAWRDKNPDKVRQYAVDAYHRDPAPRIARAQKWDREHPAEVKARNAKHRARPEYKAEHAEKQAKRRAAGELSNVVPQSYLDALAAKFGGLCAYCAKNPATSLDHVEPIARGGQHAVGNLLPACTPCNSSKHAKDARVWCQRRGIDIDQLLNAVSSLRETA